jgi:hypothetical protein
MRSLVLFETAAVVSFLGLALVASFTVPDDALPAIDVAALVAGPAEEHWMGVFVQGKHVGYAMSRDAPTADGGRIWQQQSFFRLGAMGTIQAVSLAGNAVTDADGTLRRFDFLLDGPARVFARGEVQSPTRMHVDITQAGETHGMDLNMKEPPTLSLTFGSQLAGRTLTPGTSFSVPYFDPITLTQTESVITVEAQEALPNGETGYWLNSSAMGITTRRLVDGKGQTLREDAAMGYSMLAMTKEEAQKLDVGDVPDMVAMAAIPLRQPLDESHPLRIVTVRVEGVPGSSFASEPPLQVVEGPLVTVSIPFTSELPTLPVAGDHDIEATATLPSTHAEIVGRAREVVGDAPDRLTAVRRIYDFVHDYVKKVPTLGIPNGLDVLREGRGDCNEHTALFVSLARAMGIPSRIAAGLVYSSRTGDGPGFYYHAWPEVELGGPTGWVPLDPTLGQFPADATHFKIVNGDLDKQIEIMGLIGRTRLEVMEGR